MKTVFAPVTVARFLSYVVALILVLLPFHEFLVILIGAHTGHLDGLRIWKEILIAAMAVPAAWLAWRSKQLRGWLASSWIARLYLVYAVLHFVLGAWALARHDVNASALIYSLIVNLRFIGFFLICAVVAAYDGSLKKYWPGLLLAPASVVVVFGLLQRFVLPLDFLKHFGYGPSTIPAYQTIDNNNAYQRIQSTLRGANPLGAYLVVIMSAALVRLRNSSRLKPLFVLAVAIALFLTYSRSAWIGLFISLAIIFYLTRSKQLNSKLLPAAAAAIVIIAAGLYITRNYQPVQDALLHTSKASTSASSSNAQRSSALKSGLSDVARQPLGRGPGTAGPASERNSGHLPRIAENYYLQIGQEVGVIGLIIFLAINVLMLKELWLRRADVLALCLLASFIGISFINLLSHAWTDDTLSLLFWGLAGVACAPAILIKKNKQDEAKQN